MSRRRQVDSVSQGFGARLAEVLADQRITQQALAEKLQASPSFVSSLVRGLKAPGLEFIVALHEALGVSLNWLILGTGQMYGDEVDSDLIQGALLQVQLARLATVGRSPEAAALLQNAVPGLDLLPPVPPPDRERLDAFLDTLVTGNQDVPVAISLVNRALMRVPSTHRSRVIGEAIEEQVRSRMSPSILSLLKPAPVKLGNGTKPDAGENIDWESALLPSPSGHKTAEPQTRRTATESDIKSKTRRPKT